MKVTAAPTPQTPPDLTSVVQGFPTWTTDTEPGATPDSSGVTSDRVRLPPRHTPARMRKQSLVHLHALCAKLRARLDARGDVPPGAFDGYDELGVSPSAVYHRKEVHERAVRRLVDGLTTVAEADRTADSNRATPDGGPREPEER